jgi:hypothetical protein
MAAMFWRRAEKPDLAAEGLVILAAAVLLALGAGGAAIAAWRRATFASPGGGVGVVQLDEGRLTYFGPLSGGTIAGREIESVGIDPRHRPTHWVLRDAATELLIPVDAEGAGVLLDVFALLPGLDLGAAQGAVARSRAPVTLWRRGDRARDIRRLPR